MVENNPNVFYGAFAQVMTSAAREVGCASAVSVIEAGQDCTATLQTSSKSEARPHVRAAHVAS